MYQPFVFHCMRRTSIWFPERLHSVVGLDASNQTIIFWCTFRKRARFLYWIFCFQNLFSIFVFFFRPQTEKKTRMKAARVIRFYTRFFRTIYGPKISFQFLFYVIAAIWMFRCYTFDIRFQVKYSKLNSNVCIGVFGKIALLYFFDQTAHLMYTLNLCVKNFWEKFSQFSYYTAFVYILSFSGGLMIFFDVSTQHFLFNNVFHIWICIKLWHLEIVLYFQYLSRIDIFFLIILNRLDLKIDVCANV